jgi:hypothetical protein
MEEVPQQVGGIALLLLSLALLLLAYLLSWFQMVVEVEELEKVGSIGRGGFCYLTRYDVFCCQERLLSSLGVCEN